MVPSTSNKVENGCMNMAGYGVIETSNLFLLDTYQELMDFDSDLTMTGKITSIPGKHASWWTISWKNYFLTTKIQNKSLCEVMKCNMKMVEQLYDAHRKFDELNPKKEIETYIKGILWNDLLMLIIPLLETIC